MQRDRASLEEERAESSAELSAARDEPAQDGCRLSERTTLVEASPTGLYTPSGYRYRRRMNNPHKQSQARRGGISRDQETDNGRELFLLDSLSSDGGDFSPRSQHTSLVTGG